MPRSIVAWFAVCWGLFLAAALVVGAMLIALYKETTTQRTDRAATSIARACDAIVREAGSSGATERATAKADYTVAVDRALASFPGVEGGVWQSGLGSLAYAYPTYEGSGKKPTFRKPRSRPSGRLPKPRRRRAARSSGSGIRARKCF